MRATCVTLAGLLTCAGLALAQQPGGAPPDNSRKLDQVLAGWEKAMTTLTSFRAACHRTTLDKALGATDVFEGSALFLKGAGAKQPSRASLELFKKGRPEVFDKYVCTGDFLYEYAPASKVIRIHEMPRSRLGQIGDDSFLTLMFGMKAADAKARYTMIYRGGDKWYHYIQVLPRDPRDKVDFTEARLSLWEKSLLPRQIWYRQPNGNEITWDFPKIETNVRVPLNAFDSPRPPQGWRIERVQPRPVANNTPRPPSKVRPQQ